MSILFLGFDNVAEYAIGVLVYRVKLLRSRAWPVCNATVTKVIAEEYKMGCPVARIRYHYACEGLECERLHLKPFVTLSSAEDYARNFQRRQNLTVRTKPGNPSVSVFEEPVSR